MSKKKLSSKEKSVEFLKETKQKHPWRLCPAGQNYREGTMVSTYTKRDGTVVRSHSRKNTCANNPSGKDQLYPEEMQEMARRYFQKFKNRPLGTLFRFKEKGNLYDHLIHGWVKYWNDILKPQTPLDPHIVKALIASESSFNIEAWNGQKGPRRARGLMQVTDRTIQYLSDDYKELRDHYLNLTENDMLDPNLSICAGIRWLFRKKELAEAKKKPPVTWREAIAEYKGVSANDTRIMSKFDKIFLELMEKKRE